MQQKLPTKARKGEKKLIEYSSAYFQHQKGIVDESLPTLASPVAMVGYYHDRMVHYEPLISNERVSLKSGLP